MDIEGGLPFPKKIVSHGAKNISRPSVVLGVGYHAGGPCHLPRFGSRDGSLYYSIRQQIVCTRLTHMQPCQPRNTYNGDAEP